MPTPPRPPHPPSGGTIIVVGGGATGALTAVELAEAGFHVVLVEKAKIGNGSSQRSAAAIRAQFGTPETVLGMRYSEAFYVGFHERLQTPVDERNPVIRQNGYLWLYEAEDAVPAWNHQGRATVRDNWARAQRDATMQRQYGLPVEVLTTDEVMTRWPHLDGDFAYGLVGATFCQDDGFLIPDQVYLHGVRRAKELGVTVLEGTEVVGSKVRHGRIVGLYVLNDGQERLIECEAVVNCTNAWAPRFSEMVGGMPLPISPLKRYLGFVDRPDNHFSDKQWSSLPFTIYGLGHGRVAYSRPDGNKLMMGWAHSTPPATDFADEDQDVVEPGFGHDHREGEPYVESMRRQVQDFAPRLVEKPVVATTAGFYGTTPDANPLIGWDSRLGGLIHCCGFSGHGLMHAPVSALLVRALAAGEVVGVLDASGKKRPAVRLPAPCEGRHLFLDRFAPDREFAGGEHAVL